jgi:protein-disulfide isomerase
VKNFGRIFMTFGAAIVGILMVAQGQAAPKKSTKPSWLLTVAASKEGGYIVGNPNAPIKVVEYASYTCSHCATFETKEAPILRSEYVSKGSVNLEVRSFLLNAVDIPLTLLAQCGAPGRFFGNHRAILSRQGVWIANTDKITDATNAKLEKDDFAGYNRDVYQALQLDVIAKERGISNAEVQKCLGDVDKVKRLIEVSDEAIQTYNVESTPSFLVNNELKKDVHNLTGLRAFLTSE